MSNKLFLRSLTSPYNDETRGAVLSIQDMDNNFIYLKGLSTNSINFNGQKIFLNQLNGTIKEVDLSTFNKLTINGVLSATTIQGDGSQLSGINNFYVTGGTLSNNILYLDRNDNLSAITVDLSSLETFDTQITGVTFDNNILSIVDNSGSTFNVLINNLSGLTVNGDISGTTFYGDGSQLENILNLGSNNLTIPEDTNRTLSIGNNSTLSIGDIFKSFQSSGNTFFISDDPISDNNLLLNHITLFRENNKVKARFKYDNTTIDEIKFGDVFDYYNGIDVNPIEKREKIRVTNYLKVSDDINNEETVIELDNEQMTDFVSDDIINVNGTLKIALEENKIGVGNTQGLREQKTLSQLFIGATEEISSITFHVVNGILEPFIQQGEIWVGDALHRGRSQTIGAALDALASETGVIFGLGIDGKLQILGTPGHTIKFNVNGEAESKKLVEGNNKVPASDNDGNPVELDLIQFQDLLSTVPSILTGADEGQLNTINLSEIASGIKGGFQIDAVFARRHSPGTTTFSIGSTLNDNNIVMDYVLPFGERVSLPLGARFFHNFDETLLHVSGNVDTLELKIQVSKIY